MMKRVKTLLSFKTFLDGFLTCELAHVQIDGSGWCFNFFHAGKSFMISCRLLIFSKSFFFQKILSGIPSESNSLDPDQARHIVGPDLGPNCLQRLSADDSDR